MRATKDGGLEAGGSALRARGLRGHGARPCPRLPTEDLVGRTSHAMARLLCRQAGDKGPTDGVPKGLWLLSRL